MHEQLLVLIGHFAPAVDGARDSLCLLCQFFDSCGMGNHLFQLVRQVCFLWMKWDSAISCGLAVCRVVKIKNCISSRHRFNQCGMNPSNFTCKHEYPGILLQTPICIPVDGPRENDTLIGNGLELAH